MLDALVLLEMLVAAPGPPGREAPVRDIVERYVRELGYECRTDVKGNLIVGGSTDRHTRLVVAAHMDEIALLVTGINSDGTLRVSPMGGLYPWKWGEQLVEVLTRSGSIPAVVSFGCIHTSSGAATVTQARSGPLAWDQAVLFTGLPRHELEARDVRPGVRVVLAPQRRVVTPLGDFVAAHFLDDRADLVSWILALEEYSRDGLPDGVVFAATVAEEVGGEGARYLMQTLVPDRCIALELGPSVPESPFMLDSQPTVWVHDDFASPSVDDIEWLADVCNGLGQRPHWQALSRGGSDASSAAASGQTASGITLGIPLENSHGCEIMHRDAPRELARLVCACIRQLPSDE
jgi:putative aminopeptidase FrvX